MAHFPSLSPPTINTNIIDHDELLHADHNTTTTKQDEIDQEVSSVLANLSPSEKTQGWVPNFSLFQYQGFWCHEPVLRPIIATQTQHYEHFDPLSTVLLVSAPKAGTNWLKALAFAITTRPAKNPDYSTHPLTTSNLHDHVPFLEFSSPAKITNLISDKTSATLLATHLTFTSLPDQIKSSSCPIIYLYRCPKDVCVALWHFINHLRSKKSYPPLSLDEAYALFVQGKSQFGPYWDHVLGYYEASLDAPERVMLVSYEELKGEPGECVKRLAEFVGKGFTVEEEESGAVESVVEVCGFERMSKLESNKRMVAYDISEMKVSNYMFYRKGVVGDYRNHLSGEMIRCLDEITEMKWGGTGLKFPGRRT